MSNNFSCVTSASEPEAEAGADARISPSMPSAASLRPETSQRQRVLPYQTSHQVELLNLQAETEALLQQLFLLRQQRQAAAQAACEAAKQQLLTQQQRVLQHQS
ncbi:MAG: hypothetical protein ACFB8W_23575 [Elainellaceae cyanobacterium]